MFPTWFQCLVAAARLSDAAEVCRARMGGGGLVEGEVEAGAGARRGRAGGDRAAAQPGGTVKNGTRARPAVGRRVIGT